MKANFAKQKTYEKEKDHEFTEETRWKMEKRNDLWK